MTHKIFPLSLRASMYLLILLMAGTAFALIATIAMQEFDEEIDHAKRDTAKLAYSIASELRVLVNSAQEMGETLAMLPAVQSRDAGTMEPLLANIIAKNPVYGNIVLADQKGMVWASGLALEGKPLSIAARKHFSEVMATGVFSAGEHMELKTSGRPSLGFGFPIKDAIGKVTGCVGIPIDLGYFKHLFEAAMLPSKASYLLIDHKGIMLARYFEPEKFLGKPYRPEEFQAMRTGPAENTDIGVGMDGVRRIRSYVKLSLKDQEAPYIYIRVGTPYDTVVDHIRAALLPKLTFLFCILLFSFVLIWQVGRHFILTPIATLREAIARVGQGELDIRITGQIKAREFAEVASVFDRMVASLAENIAERERAEKSLRESEAKARLLLDIPKAAAILLDRDGICLDTNETMAWRFKRKVEDIIGLVNWDLFPPEVAAARKAHFDQILRDKKFQHFIDEREGMWIESIAHPILDDQGEVAKVAVLGFDVTERVRAQQALAESERKFRLLTEQSLQGVVVLQNNPVRLAYLNPRFCEIIGHPAAEFCSMGEDSMYGLIHPDDRQLVVDRAMARLEGLEAASHYEFRIIRKGGEVRWVEVLASRIEYEGEGAILAVLVDITERRQAQEQLNQKRKLEALGTLAAGIAHDFNNILHIMTANLEIARRETASPALSQALATMGDCGLRAAALVRQVLLFARPDGDRVVGARDGAGATDRLRVEKRSVVDLAALMSESVRLEATGTGNSSVRLETHIGENLSPVFANEQEVRQVLGNLLANARNAMGEQGGIIRVNLVAEEHPAGFATYDAALPPGRYLRLTVADTGCGMDEATLRRLFEPFFTTRMQKGGTGLGLAITHGIIASLGGGIRVESVRGEGSAFHLYFPAQEERIPASGLILTKTSATATAVPAGQSNPKPAAINIMFVDDEPLNVSNWKLALAMEGFSVKGFTSGPEALTAFQKDPLGFSVVMSDVRMPGMSGSALARALREIRPEIPIIFSSGWSDEETENTLKGFENSRLLLKPHDLETISATILELL